MPDTYIDVGPMACNKDTSKVASKYVTKATQVMRETAVKTIRAAAGFTPDKGTNSKGFHFDATLTEITLGTFKGQPSVTCKLNGVVAKHPQKVWLTQTLTGSVTIAGGNSDRDVEDCIKAVMEQTTTARVIPFLKGQPKP
jgi:hypothetical protein